MIFSTKVGLRRTTVAVAFSVALAVGCATSSPVASGPQATSGPARAASTTTSMGRAGTVPKSTEPKASTESTDSPTSGAEPAACDLITERDASAAFGEPVTNGEHRNDECSWYSKNDLKTVNVIRRSGEVDEWRRGYQNDTWKKIDLGDEAYRSKALDSITFRLSETTYEVNVVFSTKGDPETIVNDLAKKVYSRL